MQLVAFLSDTFKNLQNSISFMNQWVKNFFWIFRKIMTHCALNILTKNYHKGKINCKWSTKWAYHKEWGFSPNNFIFIFFKVWFEYKHLLQIVDLMYQLAKYYFVLFVSAWPLFESVFPLPVFFFYLCFLSQTFTIHRRAGEGAGYYFNSFLPLPPALIHLTITAESLNLYIATSTTKARVQYR